MIFDLSSYVMLARDHGDCALLVRRAQEEDDEASWLDLLTEEQRKR